MVIYCAKINHTRLILPVTNYSIEKQRIITQMNKCDPKNEFKTNCVVKRHHQYLDIRSVYQTISCSQSFISSQVVIMPKARRTSYNLALKLKIVAEAEAVENNSEIAREYGISESMVRRWRKDQANLFNGEIKLSAKRKTMGCFTPKYPELDQRILEWFTEQRSQGKFFVEH